MNPRIGHSMSEDCLYLNVFTPAGHASRTKQGRLFSGRRLLPVMVWLHGGAFQQGGANRAEYDGTQVRCSELPMTNLGTLRREAATYVAAPLCSISNSSFRSLQTIL